MEGGWWVEGAQGAEGTVVEGRAAGNQGEGEMEGEGKVGVGMAGTCEEGVVEEAGRVGEEGGGRGMGMGGSKMQTGSHKC